MLVFSSAESTKSVGPSASPSYWRAYRSRMRPALTANSGSRGKIHVRCCQGRMASSCSQRQTVLLLMVATMPPRWASRTTSAVLRRERGTPRVAGNSHARALTWTTTSGGKSSGATRARAFVQAGQALIEESLAPEADDVAANREGSGDFVIAEPLGGQEDHLRAHDLKIRQRIFSRAALQDLALVRRERNDIGAFARQTQVPPEPRG